MTTTIRLLVLTFALLALNGCATHSKFACPAPQGVTCMSAPDVYSATNSGDHVTGKGASFREKGTSRPTEARRQGGQGEIVVGEGGALMLTDNAAFYPVEEQPDQLPVRTPAKVMRIWIGPWEDDAGDLHMAEHVFTELEPRRWAIGDPAPRATQTLQLISPSTHPAPGGATNAASAPGKTELTATSGRTDQPHP